MVDITHDGGVDTVVIDQRNTVDSGVNSTFDGWNILGVYDLSPANGDVVIRNDYANEFVIADAVRWTEISVPACIRKGFRCQQPICPRGDCFTPLNADDPNSKFYQAKEAIHGALDSVETVHFGFGHYEQDNARLQMKHWLYRVRSQEHTPPTMTPLPTFRGSTETFIEVGDELVLGNYSTASDRSPAEDDGDGWDCVTSNNNADSDDQQVGCNKTHPADVSDAWERERAHRIPKLGFKGTFETDIWYRVGFDPGDPEDLGSHPADPGSTHLVRYKPGSGKFGDATMRVQVEVFDCDDDGDSDCPTDTFDVFLDRVSDYAAWDNRTGRQPMQEGGFFSNERNVWSGSGDSNGGFGVNSCFGLEDNDDSEENLPTIPTASQDARFDYNILQTTVPDPRGDDWNFDGMTDNPREDFYDLGDRVPLDWQNRYNRVIQERLAPNSGGADAPDFRIASYFENEISSAFPGNPGDDETLPFSRRLRLRDPDERPLIANGLTPLAESIDSFQSWYTEWSAQAPKRDEEFICRKKVVLLVTDGFDQCHNHRACGATCPGGICPPRGFCKSGASNNCNCSDRFLGDPEFEIAELAVDPADPEIFTFVVGFGVPDAAHSGDPTLDDMAAAGGTGEAFVASNQAELQTALESILTTLETENRAFASAAIPAIQSTSSDKIFLSSFTPIPFDPNATSLLSPGDLAPGFWPGRIDAFRRPLPLDANDRPDVTRLCSASRQSGCYLWEVGDRLCEDVDTRKVYYGMEHQAGSDIPGAARPVPARLLEVPMDVVDAKKDLSFSQLSAADQLIVEDLGKVLLDDAVLETYLAETPGNIVTNEFIGDRLTNIIDTTTGLKAIPDDLVGTVEACDTDNNMVDDSFVLGDIFHASPLALAAPSNFAYFGLDQCGLAQRTDIPSNCVPPDSLPFAEDRGYRQFTADHVWRRRMLIVPANDGQLHFFDTGVRQVITDGAGEEFELFVDGSGRELFSYMPRLVMPIVKEQAEGVRHIYSMDGSVSVGDVFIDPTDSRGGAATDDERVWRTVIVGGLREAGDLFLVPDRVEGFKSGYFALDITQPDILVERDPASIDPTLIPCDDTTCDEDDSPPAEGDPSCLNDTNGELTADPDCPLRASTTSVDMPFPAELWSFTDSRLLDEKPTDPTNDLKIYYLDEDPANTNGHGVPDLGDTWSRPVIGQIAMCDPAKGDCTANSGAGLITKHVAIFGGGMDPDAKNDADPTELRGAYLYMVDVETGFPVYKRKLGTGTGSAPGDPAVLDTDSDGIFDMVYIGTTDGILYKVDLTTAVGNPVPSLVDHPISHDEVIRASDFKTYTEVQAGLGVTVTGSDENFNTPRVTDTAWDPFPILDTGGLPIYFAPTAFFIPERNRFGLAIGTGDREDLWSVPPIGPEARFFVIVDDNFKSSDIPGAGDTTACVAAGAVKAALPITESCLLSFPLTEDPIDRNLLLDPPSDNDKVNIPPTIAVTEQLRPGWVLTIPQTTTRQSRVTTEAFVVAGILVFSAFDPTTIAVAGSSDQCERTGTTRSFVLQVANASPVLDLNTTVLPPPGGGSSGLEQLTDEDRFHTIEEFTTAPFVEQKSTKNPPDESGDRTIFDAIAEQSGDTIREALIGNLPRGSRFNDAFQVVITALRNSTGVEVFASIPVAIYPADWRDQ